MHLSRACGLVIHGGAGAIDRAKMTTEMERAYREGLKDALKAGWEVLQHGGSALDATESSVHGMEIIRFLMRDAALRLPARAKTNSTLRCWTAGPCGRERSPSSSMSRTRFYWQALGKIGASAGQLSNSGPILLVGEGAEAFAKHNGVELVDAGYFFHRRAGIYCNPRRTQKPKARKAVIANYIVRRRRRC